MTPAGLAFLHSDTAARWLARIDFQQRDHLGWATLLRRELNQDAVHALLETVLLREKAGGKFTLANRMYFTRDGLEQSSGETIARYRAERYKEAGFRRVADLGCGVGGDALALAASLTVFGVDLDEIRLRMAAHNVAVYEPEGRFYPILADLRELAPLGVDALFFDPSRRDALGRRLRRPAAYHPPLSLVDAWRPRVPQMGIKISPGVPAGDLPPETDYSVEFISVGGEVKEGVLWGGDLRDPAGRRATLLPGGHSLAASRTTFAPPIGPPRAYLYEPDGAVIRAGLVADLAGMIGGTLLSPRIAYITADTCLETPFARIFELVDWFPFGLKRLRRYLREREIGRIVVKKRGSPLDPDRLARQLRGSGEREATIFLTRVGQEPAVLIGRPARLPT